MLLARRDWSIVLCVDIFFVGHTDECVLPALIQLYPPLNSRATHTSHVTTPGAAGRDVDLVPVLPVLGGHPPASSCFGTPHVLVAQTVRARLPPRTFLVRAR